MSDPASIKIPSEIDGLLARSFFFGVLAHVLRHPSAADRSFFTERDSDLSQAVDALSCSQKEKLRTLLPLLFRMCREVNQTEQIRDYECSFQHTAHGKIPAYELEYGEEHSHRQPQELSDISAFYQAFGLNVSMSSHERADHVSAECEFLHFLLFKEAYALRQGTKEQASICRDASRKFLSEHLGSWLPAFAFRLSKYGCGEIMPVAADFALELMICESEASGVCLGDQNLPLRSPEEKEEVACASCALNQNPEQL